MSSLQELKRKPKFKELTDGEQAFLLDYLVHFDAEAAARKAFNVHGRSATVYAKRVLDRPRVIAVLSEWNGANDISSPEFYDSLRSTLRQTDNWGAKVRALELVAKMKGLVAEGPTHGSEEHVNKALVELVAERVAELPVGRILNKLGIEELTFEAEKDGEEHRALGEGSAEQSKQIEEVPQGDARVQEGDAADQRGEESQ